MKRRANYVMWWRTSAGAIVYVVNGKTMDYLGYLRVIGVAWR